jgi:hypothetical protein
LLSPGIYIHPCRQQRIFRVCGMTLRVLHHDEGLVTGAVACLECRNDLSTWARTRRC